MIARCSICRSTDEHSCVEIASVPSTGRRIEVRPEHGAECIARRKQGRYGTSSTKRGVTGRPTTANPGEARSRGPVRDSARALFRPFAHDGVEFLLGRRRLSLEKVGEDLVQNAVLLRSTRLGRGCVGFRSVRVGGVHRASQSEPSDRGGSDPERVG